MSTKRAGSRALLRAFSSFFGSLKIQINFSGVLRFCWRVYLIRIEPMKNIRQNLVIFTILVSVAVSFGVAGITSADSSHNNAVLSAPEPAPTASPTGRPRRTPLGTPVPAPTSSPEKTSTPTATPTPAQTLDELQSKIRQRMFDPEVRRGRVGIKIVSLNTGKVIFENDAEKYFMPASNMKNFTVATAMERLTPDFRFVTSVYANSRPDSTGTVKGDLRIYGRGDVSISTAFNDGDYYKGIDNLVNAIAAAGVKRVDGSIVGDESYFKGFAIPEGWEWDDLQWYYGAGVSALPINDNAVDLSITPGTVGNPCAVKISPDNTLVQVANTCTTTAASVGRDLRVVKKLDRNSVVVSGTLPVGDKGFAGSISLTQPAELFVDLLKQRLALKGISVAGASRVLPANITAAPAQIEIAKLESPPFALIAAKTMKPSQNMYTETILRTLGEYGRSHLDRSAATEQNSQLDSSQLGIIEVRNFLKSIGIPTDGIAQYDGSGLSRHDLITPSAVVALYTYMAKQSKYSQAWRDALTIGGIDGTLAKRFRGTSAAGNIRGKTGTIDQVSALSGYVTTKGGEQLVLSMVVNGVAATRTRTSLMDDIAVYLADYNGKIDN